MKKFGLFLFSFLLFQQLYSQYEIYYGDDTINTRTARISSAMKINALMKNDIGYILAYDSLYARYFFIGAIKDSSTFFPPFRGNIGEFMRLGAGGIIYWTTITPGGADTFYFDILGSPLMYTNGQTVPFTTWLENSGWRTFNSNRVNTDSFDLNGNIFTGSTPGDTIPSKEYIDAIVTRATTTFYVNKWRIDPYTPTGSLLFPFKTIQDAINQIIANGDNSQSKPYTIRITPGVYVENLIMESAALVSLVMIGEGSRLQTQINPASGLSLQSTANNANFYDLHIENIQFIKPMTLTGSTNGNYFGYNFFFTNCYWPSTALVTLTNMTYPSFNGENCKLSGGITLSNITQCSIDDIGGFKSSGFTIETNESANKPYSFTGGTKVIIKNTTPPDVTWSLLNIVTLTGTALQVRGCRLGSAGGTIPVNASITAYNSYLVGNYVNNGTLSLYNTQTDGTLTGTAPVLYQKASLIKNVPAGNITSINVQAAINELDGFSSLYPSDSSYLKSNIRSLLKLSRMVYVDKFRTDAYTETGAISKPFKTIQAAINYIASVAVAGQDWSVQINSGQYIENIVLESTGLYMISLVGVGGVVGIVPASGNSIQSITNNGNLSKFRMINVEVTRPVVITGANGSTAFSDVWLQDCKFVTNATITLNCISNFSVMSTYIENDISITNVAWFYVDGGRLNGALSMTSNSTTDMPSGYTSGTTFLNNVYQMGNVTLTKVGTGVGVFVLLGGSRLNGSSNTITNPVGWTFQAYSSFIRGHFTNAGTFQQRGSFIEGTFTNTGTWTNDQASSQIKNVPAGSIIATTVQAAINELDVEKVSQTYVLNNFLPATESGGTYTVTVSSVYEGTSIFYSNFIYRDSLDFVGDPGVQMVGHNYDNRLYATFYDSTTFYGLTYFYNPAEFKSNIYDTTGGASAYFSTIVMGHGAYVDSNYQFPDKRGSINDIFVLKGNGIIEFIPFRSWIQDTGWHTFNTDTINVNSLYYYKGLPLIYGDTTNNTMSFGLLNQYSLVPSNNITIGMRSGSAEEAGSYNKNNLIFGNKSYINNTGQANIAIGNFVGYDNVPSGEFNTIIGYAAAKHIGLGYENTYIGANAGQYDTAGWANIYIGKDAGMDQYNGYYNIVMGWDAGCDTTTQQNIYIGTLAGSNSKGSFNLILGGMPYVNNPYANWQLGIDINPTDLAYPLIYGDFDKDSAAINGDLTTASLYTTVVNTNNLYTDNFQMYHGIVNEILVGDTSLHTELGKLFPGTDSSFFKMFIEPVSHAPVIASQSNSLFQGLNFLNLPANAIKSYEYYGAFNFIAFKDTVTLGRIDSGLIFTIQNGAGNILLAVNSSGKTSFSYGWGTPAYPNYERYDGINTLSNDSTLSDASDSTIHTSSAIKKYVDGRLTFGQDSTYTIPSNRGNNGDYLQLGAGGQLYWVTITSGGYDTDSIYYTDVQGNDVLITRNGIIPLNDSVYIWITDQYGKKTAYQNGTIFDFGQSMMDTVWNSLFIDILNLGSVQKLATNDYINFLDSIWIGDDINGYSLPPEVGPVGYVLKVGTGGYVHWMAESSGSGMSAFKFEWGNYTQTITDGGTIHFADSAAYGELSGLGAPDYTTITYNGDFAVYNVFMWQPATAGLAQCVTLTDTSIKINVTGVYRVSVEVSAFGGYQDMETMWGVTVNDVLADNITAIEHLDANQFTESISRSGLLSLVKNQEVKFVTYTTMLPSPGTDVVIRSVNFNIEKIR